MYSDGSVKSISSCGVSHGTLLVLVVWMSSSLPTGGTAANLSLVGVELSIVEWSSVVQIVGVPVVFLSIAYPQVLLASGAGVPEVPPVPETAEKTEPSVRERSPSRYSPFLSLSAEDFSVPEEVNGDIPM